MGKKYYALAYSHLDQDVIKLNPLVSKLFKNILSDKIFKCSGKRYYQYNEDDFLFQF